MYKWFSRFSQKGKYPSECRVFDISIMECNKEDAIRAREIAERKLKEKDFSGAKKIVLEAKTLFPELDGIPQMLATLEVYIASEKKINGEINWYEVLGVNPSADEETIRKQYRKLALILHPDKNKSTSAEGAFKVISEAWSLLSDKSKRLAYNKRRLSKGIQHKILTKSANGFDNVSKRASSSAKVAKNSTLVQPRTNTFWTICHKCNMYYEYLKVYLNNTLLCPNCRKPFHALKTSPPANFSKKTIVSPTQQRNQKPSYHAPKGTNRTNISSTQQRNQKPSHFAPNGTNNTEKLKRDHEVGSFTESLLKKRRVNDNGHKPNISCDFMQLDIRSLKVEKARIEIRRKIGEWHLEAVTKATDAIKSKETRKRKQKENKKSSVKGNPSGVCRNGVSSSSETVANDEQKVIIEPVVMKVPDPDFYDFDQERTENSFNENQVWAVYDDDDGMPRIYAMIQKVISLIPFQVEISWLKSKTNSEFGPLKWVVAGFYKTCGDFKSGKHEINKSLNSFSHKVDWVQGPVGNVCIYPKRGDVWALYRNWSPNWNEHTPDETIHMYDMVEVLGKYGNTVHIIPLTKVCGFKTVFHKELDPDKVIIIPKEEMFRFSHQVPSHTLTYRDGQNAPVGCLELDPAATPLELLQIAKENNNQQKKTMLKYSRRQHRHP